MKKVLEGEILKETCVKGGSGAARAIATKGGSGANASAKTKSAITRMINAGELKRKKDGTISFTAKGKKKYS